MNYEQIESSVIRAKAGNSEDLLKLIEQFKPFIFKTAKEYNIKVLDLYDLSQIGYITLINAVEKYKIGSHTFSSYVYTAISNAFRYAARSNKKLAEEYSLNTPVQNIEFEGADLIDCIDSLVNIEEDIINLENNKKLRKAVAALPAHELEFIIMIYYCNVKVKVYAEKKGISYNNAIRFKNMILEKLKKEISIR